MLHLQREHLTRLLDAPFPRALRRILLLSRSRILITQFDKLGDVLCSTAALRLLRETLPGARLVVAVQPYAYDVVAANPDVDEVLAVSVPWSSSRFAGGLRERARTVWRVGRSLRSRRFHLGLDLQGNPLNALLMRLAGIPLRVGMAGLGGNLFLTAGQPMDWFANRVAFRLRLVERLTGNTGRPVTRFDLKHEDRQWAQARIAQRAASDPLAILCPTAENALRMWDERRFVELGARLSDRAVVAFCHAPGDAETASRFERAWRDNPRCHVVETETLGRLGAMMSHASVVVSGDSAPMHLAVAVGTPVVAIFGPSPPSAAGPIDWDYNRVVEPAVICGPCLWGPHAPRCDVRRCLDSISVDRVARATCELLDQGKAPPSPRPA
ncbi:MAG: glycosyltransferase family 9 protein [Phycisphaerae bacterium]|nr:glycosyltransferase family 9 protein [Phycisphaerae bacterium]